MKRSIYLTYLGLLILSLLSCQKEQVEPQAAIAAADALKLQANCTNYSYNSKSGPVQVGTVSGDVILVSFDPTLTLKQKQKIMRNYRIFDFIETADYYSETGDILSFVHLKAGASCTDIESLRTSLQSINDVHVVLLTYLHPQTGMKNQYFNGIFVTLKSLRYESYLVDFAQTTNTQIIEYAGVYGPLTYFLRVDKNSTSDIFGIISSLNSSNKVTLAEPDTPLSPLRKKQNAQPRTNIYALNDL